jgi:hypothetical protein
MKEQTKRKASRKKPSLSALKRKAWAAFSRHVRQKEAADGYGKCVTCSTVLRWQEAHAGHFVHASRQSPLSYDERNVHLQCPQCNYYGMQGLAPIRYTQYMQARYGEPVVEELLAMKHSGIYLRRAELEDVIARYGA